MGVLYEAVRRVDERGTGLAEPILPGPSSNQPRSFLLGFRSPSWLKGSARYESGVKEDSLSEDNKKRPVSQIGSLLFCGGS